MIEDVASALDEFFSRYRLKPTCMAIPACRVQVLPVGSDGVQRYNFLTDDFPEDHPLRGKCDGLTLAELEAKIEEITNAYP